MTDNIDSPNGHDDGTNGNDSDATPERARRDADGEESGLDPTPDGGVAADDSSTWFPDEDGPAPAEDVGGVEEESDEDAEREGPYIDPEKLAPVLAAGSDVAEALSHQVGEHTVNVNPDLDEDAFFSGTGGEPTVVDRYHLEKAVPTEKKRSFREIERYWVNKPFAFVVLFHSEKENERKYYVVEPHLAGTEQDLRGFLTEKLTSSITYSWRKDDDSPATRATVIEEETYDLLSRYDMYTPPGDGGFDIGRFLESVKRGLGLGGGPDEGTEDGARAAGRTRDALRIYPSTESLSRLDGSSARPESAVLAGDETSLTEYQVEKLLYYLRRDFIGFERIDPIKHDVNVEDISCDGYDSPVFVYHTDHEQLITNVEHGRGDLDDFVVKLAQRSGKGISKRQPQVDATLPDGSRAQLTLGTEVSDRGTNYTIRQFKDVPFTPIDLVNWHTFSLDQVALLWLCIENNKSIMFAGGTASGKTTSLNALSLFIPSNAKIVSIEDTREVELPQRNWIASVTRPSFATDDRGDIDEFDLLEAALRQRPDYLVMGEVRGEEGRTLFQMMSTGHTTYTTFHADSVGEVIDRFTTDPINVSKSLFTALDLVTVQVETRVQGRKVRRNRTLTEINRYDAELEEVNVQDVYRWQPDTDEFKRMVHPSILDEIQFDRGWNDDRLRRELFERRVLLAYLIDRDIRTYAEVAAAIQGYISAPETIMGLIASDRLDGALADLRSMENVLIDIDPEKEEMVPRPDPNERVLGESAEILERAEAELFPEYEDVEFEDAAAQLREAAEFDWNTDNAPETLEVAAADRAPDDVGTRAPDDPARGIGPSETPEAIEAREAQKARWNLEGIEPLFEPAEGED